MKIKNKKAEMVYQITDGHTVTHPSANRARRRAFMLIETRRATHH